MFVAFYSCCAYQVAFTEPQDCEKTPSNKPFGVQLLLHPLNDSGRKFMGQLASNELHVEIAIKSSRASDVWNFDVPPTPLTSVERYVGCQKRSGALYLKHISGSKVRQTGFSTGAHSCYLDKEEQVYVHGREGMDVLWKAEMSLAEGVHVLTARLLNTTSGFCWGHDVLHMVATGDGEENMTSGQFNTNVVWKHRIEQREKHALMNERLNLAGSYTILHPSLRDPSFLNQYLDPSLLTALKANDATILADVLRVEAPGVFGLAVFTPRFCHLLMEEMANANVQPILFTRPNTMNNYGIVLEEIGFGPWLDAFVDKVLNPLSELLFSEWGGGTLDSRHAFTLRYRVGEDEHLNRHMDQSEVTLNICLGGEFEGADLYFHGMRDHADEEEEIGTFNHRPGVGVIHVGQQYHGVNRLISGERHNMVVWGKSSKYRSSAAEVYAGKCESQRLESIKQHQNFQSTSDLSIDEL